MRSNNKAISMGDAENLFQWVTNNFPLFSVQCLTPARWTGRLLGGNPTEEEGKKTFEVTFFCQKLEDIQHWQRCWHFPVDLQSTRMGAWDLRSGMSDIETSRACSGLWVLSCTRLELEGWERVGGKAPIWTLASRYAAEWEAKDLGS